MSRLIDGSTEDDRHTHAWNDVRRLGVVWLASIVALGLLYKLNA